MATSLYGTSYASLYSKELKNIRAEQEVEKEQRLAKKEGQKVLSGGAMQAQAWIGSAAKKVASKRLKETAIFDIKGKLTDPITKYESIARPELFDKGGSFLGDVGKTLYEGFESYTGMEFGSATWGGPIQGSSRLTSEFVSAAVESGAGEASLGIAKSSDLFKVAEGAEAIAPGSTQKIFATIGKEQIQVGTATLGEGGAITTKISEAGVEKAVGSQVGTSAGSIAGTAAAGIGIGVGTYQAVSGFAEGDVKSGIAGTAKAVGSALMFTPAAPIGLALSGVGTLLDFI